MTIALVTSPANIAFVKYWGRRDDALILPLNASVSMNLDACSTTTSCEWGEWEGDSIKIKYAGKGLVEVGGVAREKALKVIGRVRTKLNTNLRVHVESENNFPEATGIASSASGFSALTMALYESCGVHLDERELSIETRLSGSGSAARSIPDGFVIWEQGSLVDGSDSYAHSIAPAEHWDLRDIVCVLDPGEKKVSSGEGHVRAHNEYLAARLTHIETRVQETIRAIETKDLEKLGMVTEVEALSLHMVCMMSDPPIFYLNGDTFRLMEHIRNLRAAGTMAYYTMDAGANVHIITESQYEAAIVHSLKNLGIVQQIIINKPARGAHLV
jgi:diphosphomevalonate decarboxylase